MTTTLPRVPCRPEPLAVLQARYPAALVELVDLRDFVTTPARREAPSGEPVHVFDTEDGLRLIVSRERCLDGRVGVHVSASFHDLQRVRQTWASRGTLLAWVVQQWQAVAQERREPELIGFSDGGVPHWFVERPQ